MNGPERVQTNFVLSASVVHLPTVSSDRYRKSVLSKLSVGIFALNIAFVLSRGC